MHKAVGFIVLRLAWVVHRMNIKRTPSRVYRTKERAKSKFLFLLAVKFKPTTNENAVGFILFDGTRPCALKTPNFYLRAVLMTTFIYFLWSREVCHVVSIQWCLRYLSYDNSTLQLLYTVVLRLMKEECWYNDF